MTSKRNKTAPEKPSRSGLIESEVLESSPIPIWVEDFSAVKSFFNDLKEQGISDIESYFSQHPDAARRCVELIRVVDVNRAALELHGAAGKKELLAGLANTFTSESFDSFRQELVCLWNGETRMSTDSVVKTLSGELRNVTIYFSICAGFEETLSRAIISLIDITERKRMEEALSLREREYRTLVDNIPACLTRFDADLRIIFQNASSEKAFGLRPDELVEHIFTEDKGPGSKKGNRRLVQSIRGVFEKGAIDQVEMLWNTLAGERLFEILHVPECDENGTVVSVLGIAHDITDRKQVEEALAASERRMAQCLANMPGFPFTFRGTQDGHFSFPYASPGIEKLYGLKPEDVREDMMPLHQLTHPEDQPRIEAAIAESAQKMALFQEEFRVCRPNIPERWIECISKPGRDEDGSVLWHGIMLDITERKQAEAEIQRLADLQSAIINNAAYMVISGTVDGTVTLFNPAAEQALGYTAEECVGKLTPSIWHDSDEIAERAGMFSEELGITIEPGFEVFVAKSRLGLPNEHEWTYIRKDGSRFPVLLSVTALRDSQGNISGFLGLATDITERKHTEEVLAASERRMAQCLANMPGFAYTFRRSQDGHACFPYASPGIEKLYGLKPEDVREDMMPLHRLAHPDDQDRILATVDESARTMTTHRCEFRICRPDAPERWVGVSSEPVHNTDGSITWYGIMVDISERKRAEEELREYSKRIQDLYNHAPCGYHSLDKDGVIVQINDTELDWLGYTREELVGRRRFSDLLTPASLKVFQREFPLFKERGRVRDLHFDMVGKDGAVMSILLNATAITDAEGNYVMSRSVVHDVTELTLAQKAAAEEQERLRFIFEALPIGVSLNRTLSDGTEFRMINDAHLRIAGIQRGQDKMETWRHVTHPDDQERQRALTREIEKGKTNQFTMDKRYIHPDGRVVWVMFSMQRRKLDHGAFEDLCTAVDITERKLAEEKLAHLASIVESSSDAIIGKALDGTILSWNRGAERIYGYTETEIIGHPISTLVPSELRTELDGIMESIRHGEKVDHLETIRMCKDGQRIHVSLTVSPIRDSSGQVVGASAIARDITERKLVEEKIHQLNMELEERVTERTAQLAAANKELEAFAYSVSHDLRAPLRHIDGFVGLLKKNASSGLDEQSLHYMETISGSAKRMGMLIDDLLSFSRMCRSEMLKIPVNLGELVKEVIRELESETKNRIVKWTVGSLPQASCDRAMLRIVLFNLISNALKFTQKRKQAEIEIGCEPDKDHEITIFVRDNGAGFDPQYVDKLFGVFERLHSTDEFEGTGIGLANVRRIIERHDGKAWAEGAVDQGATFYFSLPQAR